MRKLAIANAIPTVSGGAPVKASMLNAELKKANVYGKAQQAQVDAWQKIRNDAAHGIPGFEAYTLTATSSAWFRAFAISL